MTLNNVDVSGFNALELEFYFYPNSMETGEDFWVRVNDGSAWVTVAAYASGTSFNNGSFYVATVTIPSTSFNFSNPMDFRFQCDASANSDNIYIDAVTLTGIAGTALVEAGSTINELGAQLTPVLPTGLTESNSDEIIVYPNPAIDMLTLDYSGEIQSIKVMSTSGQYMKDIIYKPESNRVDISALPTGMYIILFEKDGNVIPKKFMKL